MSPLIAFYAATSIAGVSLIGLFLVRKLRFIIWSGWFRAVIICEDGDIVTRTIRLKKSDTDFTVRVKGKLDTYHLIAKEPYDEKERKDAIKAINEVREKKEEPTLSINEIPNIVENPSNRRIYRQGRFRIPVAYYNAHQSEPIDMQNLRKFSVVSATRYREIAKNTVTSQLLNAFQENPMKEAMALFMAVGIILVGILILGYFLNSKLETIAQLSGG